MRQRGSGWLIVPIEGETGWPEMDPMQNIAATAKTSTTHLVLSDGYGVDPWRFETTTMCTKGPRPVVGRECVLKGVDYSSGFNSCEWWLKRQAHVSSHMSSYHFPAFENACVYTMEFGK